MDEDVKKEYFDEEGIIYFKSLSLQEFVSKTQVNYFSVHLKKKKSQDN